MMITSLASRSVLLVATRTRTFAQRSTVLLRHQISIVETGKLVDDNPLPYANNTQVSSTRIPSPIPSQSPTSTPSDPIQSTTTPISTLSNTTSSSNVASSNPTLNVPATTSTTSNTSLERHFDSQRYVAMMVKEDFTPQQAEAIISLVSEAIQESLNGVTRNMVKKTSHEEAVAESTSEFEDLRKDITIVESGDSTSLRVELEKIKADTDKLRTIIQEEVNRVHGGIRLDISLDKSRVKTEAEVVSKDIVAVNEQIDFEIKKLTERMGKIDSDLRASLFSFMGAAFSFFESVDRFNLATDFKPDILVAIGGGGFLPARIMRTYLKLALNRNVPIQAIGLALYASSEESPDTESPLPEVQKTQWLDYQVSTPSNLLGKSILIVDEVDDTRRTLGFAVQELRKDADMQRVKWEADHPGQVAPDTRIGVFVLHNKMKKKEGTLPEYIMNGNYFAAEEHEDIWLAYPWDALDIDAHTEKALEEEAADRAQQNGAVVGNGKSGNGVLNGNGNHH
ncbi:hypothetical protein SmJEL517_g03899 [Synchytrium microbalum]|uniref:Phosphoribosyltransferase domain-containing protein n=1 Tax=Synchytrium microbalum TaxID=1806994 RepID=A0A507C1Y4_9FUNG|nr:uncharacterized protein SmJEL517_g03899 [Synchytrium microbalum]TPX33069.1 hypothetical protein SmJEL517_g03899 [Synchytrium microbalum]